MLEESQLYSDIGDRVRSIRKERKLTQADLAAGVGMSRAAVANIEAGRQRLFVHTLFHLAHVLRVEPSAFIQESTQEFAVDIERDLDGNLPAPVREFLLTIHQGGGSTIEDTAP